MSKSTCWDVLYRTCRILLKMNSVFKIISWPIRDRAHAIMEAFQEINGFEGVIGCIDGSHIRILPPRDHPNSYCNRKIFHSVSLQGLCDNKKLFTHVYAGEPSSIHDSRLFEKSDPFEGIQTGQFAFPHDSHMLGDLAYNLSDYMMVSFKSNINLSNRQENFNIKLSQIRVHIENAFALLKGRFRRLKFMETGKLIGKAEIMVGNRAELTYWISFKTALIQSFADRRDLDCLVQELTRTHPYKNESLLNFGSRLQLLRSNVVQRISNDTTITNEQKLCHITYLDKTALNTFIAGCSDLLRNNMHLRKPKTLEDALAYVNEFENF
ncbi:uncharacterized protein LOC115875718 [Sitophilus oryzae]|uniref:Uncharacterized protein LOC115875718 n=1 Tax=Sitophilus oryzae TaxID=7048 RepID=A0A6J2X7C3_SITOR|nr:uncharacterized protein LOC115875718 [Sitophilus oryzae]